MTRNNRNQFIINDSPGIFRFLLVQPLIILSCPREVRKLSFYGEVGPTKGKQRIWNKEVFGDVKTRKKECLVRVEEIDALEVEGSSEP